MEKKKITGIIIGIIAFICVAVLMVLCFFVGMKIGTKQQNTQEPTKTEKENITDEDKAKMEKVAKIVFSYEDEKITSEEFTSEEKINMTLAKKKKNIEATGTELKETFKEYFGTKLKLEFPNIKCFIEHETEEQNIRYRFDKTLDKYVYNDNHPGHGGGNSKPYGSYLEGTKANISNGKYILTAPVIFYGGKICYDVSGCEYEAAYKSYEDAKNKSNSLVSIKGNKTYWVSNGDEFPIFEEEKLYNDYKDKLDTYSFVFEKENGNLVFKEYKKD